jgi:hypothetical protein
VFNLFWRPYVPGFRVRPHDDVPGFNIDQNGLPRRASAWSDAALADTVTQQYPDPAQTEMPYGMSLPTAGPEGLVQSAPPIGLAGFRVSAQDDVPGFNFRPTDDVPDFDPDDAVEEQETDSPSQTPPPVTEEAVRPAPPQFPNWIYNLVTMLPQVLSAPGPFPGQHVAVNSPLGLPSTEPPVPRRWPFSEARQRYADMNIGSRGANTRVIPSQSAAEEAISSTWLRPQAGGWPNTQAAKLANPSSAEITRQSPGLPSMMEAEPVAGSNFILASDRAAGERASRPTLLEYQQQLSAPLEREPERMSSSVMGASQPSEASDRAEDSRLIEHAYAQVEKPQVASRVDLFRRDAAGLPIGTILSGIRSPDSIAPDDLNVHLVGDGNSLEDVPRNERHERGVEASIADHLAKGFELVARGPRAVDVPGFSSPRLYDYIIRDPVTRLNYGVEVKTTIMSTIRLDRQQVMKDAVVVAQGAKVRALDNVELYGVSYSVYCFGCEALDVRSAVLLSKLQNAGVPVVPGVLPGDIRP